MKPQSFKNWAMRQYPSQVKPDEDENVLKDKEVDGDWAIGDPTKGIEFDVDDIGVENTKKNLEKSFNKMEKEREEDN